MLPRSLGRRPAVWLQPWPLNQADILTLKGGKTHWTNSLTPVQPLFARTTHSSTHAGRHRHFVRVQNGTADSQVLLRCCVKGKRKQAGVSLCDLWKLRFASGADSAALQRERNGGVAWRKQEGSEWSAGWWWWWQLDSCVEVVKQKQKYKYELKALNWKLI